MRRVPVVVVVVVIVGAAACGRVDFGATTATTSADAPTASIDGAIVDAAGDARPPLPATFFGSSASLTLGGSNGVLVASVTAGDLLVCALYWQDVTAPPMFTDSLGTPFTTVPAIGGTSQCGSASNLTFALGLAPATGSDTFTYVQNSAQDFGFVIAEYGWGPAPPVVASTGSFVPSVDTLTLPVSVTAAAGDLVVAQFLDSQGGGSMTVSAGVSLRQLDPVAYSIFVDDAPAAVAGDVAITATLPTTTPDQCGIGYALALRQP